MQLLILVKTTKNNLNFYLFLVNTLSAYKRCKLIKKLCISKFKPEINYYNKKII